MSYLDWKAGDKVVCIDDTGFRGKYDWERMPVAGQVYTIRSIVGSEDHDGYQIGILLCEIVNAENPRRRIGSDGRRELGFRVRRFRPVEVRKTSIEVFERLLNPSDHDKHLIEVFDFVSMQGDLQ